MLLETKQKKSRSKLERKLKIREKNKKMLYLGFQETEQQKL